MSIFSKALPTFLSSDLRVLDEAFDVSETGKVAFSKKGLFLRANKAALEALYPLTNDDLLDLSRSDFLDFLYDSAEETDESIRKAIFSRFQANDRLSGSNFTEVITSQLKGLYLSEARTLPSGATLFTFVNISKLRRVEENIIQLSRFNNQLLHAIEAVATGIIISNHAHGDNRFLYVNDSFCKFIGKNKVDILGLNWDQMLDILGAQDDRDSILTAIEYRYDAEVSVEINRDDAVSYYTFKVSPVFQAHGELDLYIGVLADVSLLKQREFEFFHSQKLESLGQLAAGVAHDFNNILSIIGGYSLMAKSYLNEEQEGVLEGADRIEKMNKYLDSIDAAAYRGAGLTRKMLTFSRHKVVTKTVVDVCDVVKEQEELLQPLISADIKFRTVLPSDGLNIRGSADSLEQIIMNLVLNARDAMLHGGHLRVDVLRVLNGDVPGGIKDGKIGGDDCVVIRVSDDGMGMDRKTLDCMFDPFFTTKDQGKGTGLGLSVVYGLVQEMGGVMDVESALNQGTVMSCYFPQCHDIATKTLLDHSADLSTMCFDGFTVLVAEDEPDLLVMVTKMLEDLGFKVIGAENGNKALELADIHEDEIDILLTDVVMPEVNGVKLAELVTAINPDIKVIFMSGYPATGDMAPVDLPDDIEFITKPVDYGSLARLLLLKLREGRGDLDAQGFVRDMPRWANAINNHKA